MIFEDLAPGSDEELLRTSLSPESVISGLKRSYSRLVDTGEVQVPPPADANTICSSDAKKSYCEGVCYMPLQVGIEYLY